MSTATTRDLSNLPRVLDAPTAKRGSSVLAVLTAAANGALLGYLAIVAGWGITEAAGIADGRSLGPVALYVAVLGAVYGLVSGAASDVLGGVLDRAVVRAATGAAIGALVGAASGAVSQVLFDALQQTDDPSAPRFYLLRALSWALFGLGIGVANGITERSTSKAVNGLVGGLVGGALGGAAFHWLGQHVESASAARLASLAAIGVAVGASIGLVEIARRQAWVRVLAGGMAGKEFILHHDVTHVGSSPKCQITLLKDPAAQAFHLRIDEQGGRRVLTTLDGATTTVNGAPVRSRTLRSGDHVQVGATTLEYRERATA